MRQRVNEGDDCQPWEEETGPQLTSDCQQNYDSTQAGPVQRATRSLQKAGKKNSKVTNKIHPRFQLIKITSTGLN